MVKGTYTILVNLPEPATIAIGALGEREFPAGWYAYTGSAFGSGGFSRVDRHHEMAAGERDTRHWHIDYFLGDSPASIASVVRTPEADIECTVADAAAEVADPVAEFGASDCDCEAHLHYAPERDQLLDAVTDAHRS